MNTCRACLSYAIGTPADDYFIDNYNKLTDLEINKEDGITQFFCLTCVQTVHSFVMFREKCHETEAALKTKTSSIKVETSEVEEQKEDDQSDEADALDLYGKVFVEIKVKEEQAASYEYYGSSQEDDPSGQWLSVVNNFNPENLEGIPVSERDIAPTTAKCKTHKNKTKQKYGMKIDHNIEFECGLCNVMSKNIHELNTHLETHITSEACENCGLKFLDWPGLLAHRLIHLPKNANHKCHICLKMYKTPSSLEYHYLTMHHSGQDKRVRCVTCWRAFDTPKKLRKHAKTAHGGPKYQCDYCQKWFKTKPNLRRHINTHADKHYLCDMCDFRSNQKTGLRAHKIAKHSTDRSYCPNCSMLCADSDILTRHLTRCKRFLQVCNVCGKEMDNPQAFFRHTKTHDPQARYRCPREDCGAEFRTSKALRVHKDRHENNPRYQCPYCSRRFFYENVLVRHKRIHTGEKPYSCGECGKTFAANYTLKVHMKTHGFKLIVKRNQDSPEALSEIGYQEMELQ